MRKDYKDILIGYIGTLPDEQCHEIYYFLTGTGIDTTNSPNVVYIKNVRLTHKQYNLLIWRWGKRKLNKCIDILDKWLEEKGSKIHRYISHYKQLITWVEDRYLSAYGDENDKGIRYGNIDTARSARNYIMSIPKEIRGIDPTVELLVNRFGNKILD